MSGKDNMGNPLRLLSPCFKAYPHFSSRFAITISDCNRDFRKKTRRRNYLAASARSVTIREEKNVSVFGVHPGEKLMILRV